jgi:hypothetical protein
MNRGQALFLYPLTDEDKESLRIAYLARELLLKVKSGPISIPNIWGTERESGWLEGFGREELDKAFEKLLYWTPDGPLIRLRSGHAEWYETTSIGRDMTTAELLFKLIEPQYQKSKDAVRNEKRWDRARGACVYLALISGMLMFGIQFIYLPPQGGALTFEPIPVKIAAGAFAVLLVLGGVLAYFGRKQWVACEIEVAVSLYDAYSRYKNFIADSAKKRSLEEAWGLVKRATGLLELAKSGSAWATLAPEYERIANIGKQVQNVVLPAMQDHIRSRKMGDVLVGLARCFMESKRESQETAVSELRDLDQRRRVPSTGRWSKLSNRLGSYSHTHPYVAGGAISVTMVLLAYEAWVNWITPGPVVPNEIVMLTMLAAMAALGKFLSDALRRQV